MKRHHWPCTACMLPLYLHLTLLLTALVQRDSAEITSSPHLSLQWVDSTPGDAAKVATLIISESKGIDDLTTGQYITTGVMNGDEDQLCRIPKALDEFVNAAVFDVAPDDFVLVTDNSMSGDGNIYMYTANFNIYSYPHFINNVKTAITSNLGLTPIPLTTLIKPPTTPTNPQNTNTHGNYYRHRRSLTLLPQLTPSLHQSTAGNIDNTLNIDSDDVVSLYMHPEEDYWANDADEQSEQQQKQDAFTYQQELSKWQWYSDTMDASTAATTKEGCIGVVVMRKSDLKLLAPLWAHYCEDLPRTAATTTTSGSNVDGVHVAEAYTAAATVLGLTHIPILADLLPIENFLDTEGSYYHVDTTQFTPPFDSIATTADNAATTVDTSFYYAMGPQGSPEPPYTTPLSGRDVHTDITITTTTQSGDTELLNGPTAAAIWAPFLNGVVEQLENEYAEADMVVAEEEINTITLGNPSVFAVSAGLGRKKTMACFPGEDCENTRTVNVVISVSGMTLVVSIVFTVAVFLGLDAM